MQTFSKAKLYTGKSKILTGKEIRKTRITLAYQLSRKKPVIPVNGS